jgi:hypothetical protein
VATESNAAVNNEAVEEWQVSIDGHQAFLAYERKGDRIVYLHTEVPPELEGHGVASTLAKAALDEARARHQTVVPLCPFVSSYIKRHPEYQDLVDHAHRSAE